MFNILSIFSYQRYAIRSPDWKSVRDNHIKNNPFCAACGTSKKLEVHHIVPVHIDPSKELDSSNLITLCNSKCHLLFGHLMWFKSWNPNVVEDCSIMLDKISTRP